MHNKIKTIFIPLLFLLSITNAFADDGPLPVTQAFQFDAVVKANHILATWNIADGNHLFRDNFHFKSATPGVTLGTPIFPKGKMIAGIKADGSEGQEEAYFHKVTIDIPITKSSGTQLKLIAQGQGCSDKFGICYPPHKWEKLLTLADASTSTNANAASSVNSLSSELGLGGNATGQPLSPQKAFQFNAKVRGKNIIATWTIAPKYHLYKNSLSFVAKTPGLSLGKPNFPPGIMKQGIKPDGSEGEVETYVNNVTVAVPYTLTNKVSSIKFAAKSQGCSDEFGICYPPQQRLTTVTVPNKPTSFWHTLGQLIFAFFSGLALTFTPCVLPMLPIISSIIVGQGDKVTKARGGMLALIYVLGTAVVWAVAGVIAGIFGAQAQAYTQIWYVKVPIAGILVLLSLAMFGLYNLQLPASLQSKAQEKSTGLKGGTIVGVFLMGVLAAFIAGACVSPILILNLGVAMQTHNAVLGGSVMFLMALGMGVPFILIGIGAGWLLPKAGGWMDTVKYVFGVMLIGLALYIVETVTWIPILYLWAPFLIVTGVYMGAARSIPEGASGWQTLWKGLGIFLVIWGILALIGAMQGNRDILRPIQLGAVGGNSVVSSSVAGSGSAVAAANNPEAMFTRVHTVKELDAKLASAQAAGKPAFLDYYATWCTDCNIMKNSVFSDPQVQKYMREHFVVLQADVSNPFNKDTKPLKDKFGVFGPPALLFFNAQGQLAQKKYGELNKDEFLNIARGVAQSK